MLYSLAKNLLFSLEPEVAHNLVLHIASLSPTLGKLTGINHNPAHSLMVGKTLWTFPVGLAAGLDKNADALEFFSAQGFGAIECGTVTLKGQPGNPTPRMFRYPEEKSLRNAMGFPNQGLLEILPRIKGYHSTSPLGINIGKNKYTNTNQSIEELSLMMETLNEYCHYFVINVSSPNTPGLRELQERSYLTELFRELNDKRNGVDLYLKVAPDLSEDKVVDLTHLAQEHNLTGIIATNTTMMPERGVGGVSGELLKSKSREIQQIILKEKNNLELIAVGGISSPKDLFDLWKEGGKAAQIYTSYIYGGPGVLHEFAKAIDLFMIEQKMSLQDFFNLSDSERKYRLKDYRLS
jgi:dihydroorotate dehydrogenase